MNVNRFKETEIGKLPQEWEVVRIGDVVKINELNVSAKTYPHNKIEYTDIDSVTSGQIANPKLISLDEAPSRAKRIIRNDDIIISTVRPNLKHFAMINQAKPNSVVSTGFAVITPKQIDPKFLYYYLTTGGYTNFLTAIADSHTSTYPSYNPDVIENSICPYPELSEQHSIGNFLYVLDSKITINNRMNQTLEEIVQAIFKHWFVDFEFPDENGKPYKSSGGKMVYSEELGKEIPEGWEVTTLDNIVELAYGRGLPERSRRHGEFPVLGSNGIVDFHNESLVKGPGIVIGRKGTLGSVILVEKDFFPIDTTFYVVPKLNDKRIWFYYLMLKEQTFLKISSDSAVPGLNRSQAYSNKMTKPESEIISKFNEFVAPLFNELFSNEKEIHTLKNIRDTLLPKLISGQIRVNAKSNN